MVKRQGRRFGKKGGRCKIERLHRRPQFPHRKFLIRQIRRHGLDETRLKLVASAEMGDVITRTRELNGLVGQDRKLQRLLNFQRRRRAA